jgi:hypothetical protein
MILLLPALAAEGRTLGDLSGGDDRVVGDVRQGDGVAGFTRDYGAVNYYWLHEVAGFPAPHERPQGAVDSKAVDA